MRSTERPEAPNVAQELLLLEDALGILGERDEELVLLGRELHRLTAHGDDARGQIDLEVAHGEPRMARAVRATQHGPHARDELVVDERLAYVFTMDAVSGPIRWAPSVARG
jgi:hypothetical protein